MKKFFKAGSFLLFLAILTVAVMSAVTFAMSEQKSMQATWRYKMTVTVETPEGIKTGSAVREISNSLQGNNWPDVGNPAGVRGEAVVVDLSKRGVFLR